MSFRDNVFPITSGLWLGPFASPQRLPALVAGRVTHVLNVGEAPSVLSVADGPFRAVVWHAITDWERIPDRLALECLTTLHEMVCEDAARVYIHCIAGQNRSPTIIWLYLVACGMHEDAAREMIERRAWDAVAGHRRLVDHALVDAVRTLGVNSFQPHPRPEALTPIQC